MQQNGHFKGYLNIGHYYVFRTDIKRCYSVVQVPELRSVGASNGYKFNGALRQLHTYSSRQHCTSSSWQVI